MDDSTQLALFDIPPEALACSESAEVAEFTGELLRKSDPGRFGVIIDLLADGRLSQRQIADLTKTSRNTISAIAKRVQVHDIEPVKKRLAIKARNVSELAFDELERRLVECPEEIGARDLVIVGGTAADKSQVLSGHATQIHAWQPAQADADIYEQLRRADAVDVEARDADEPPEMGLPPPRAGAKGDGQVASGDRGDHGDLGEDGGSEGGGK